MGRAATPVDEIEWGVKVMNQVVGLQIGLNPERVLNLHASTHAATTAIALAAA